MGEMSHGAYILLRDTLLRVVNIAWERLAVALLGAHVIVVAIDHSPISKLHQRERHWNASLVK
jgi:hypothetical protein